MLRVVQDLPTNIPHDPADPNLDISGHLPNHTNDRQSALPVTCIETRVLNTVSGSSPSSMMFAVNHSFLDITALIPSPDWLIGVDSLELCKDERNEHEDNAERNSTITLGDLHRDPLAHHGPSVLIQLGPTDTNNFSDLWWPRPTHDHYYPSCPSGTIRHAGPNTLVVANGFHPTRVCKIPPG